MSQQKEKTRLPEVNAWDVPEFMPGANPRCQNPAQREAFETRCVEVYRDEMATEGWERHQEQLDTAKQQETEIQQLREMFPTFEVALIHKIYVESKGLDDAISKLLFLSSDAVMEQGNSSPSGTKPLPERKVVQEGDADGWPALSGKDGWEVYNPDKLEADLCHDMIGDTDEWKDRADKAKDLPVTTSPNQQKVWGPDGYKLKKRKSGKLNKEEKEEDEFFDNAGEVEYDVRMKKGAKRAKKFGKHVDGTYIKDRDHLRSSTTAMDQGEGNDFARNSGGNFDDEGDLN